jgi:maltooligosyltrehalose trehalohydrolase
MGCEPSGTAAVADTGSASPRPGAHVGPDGTTFTVWATAARTVSLELSAPQRGRLDLGQTEREGWWSVTVPELRRGVAHGARYRYRLDGGEPLADPASAWQPDGVHGESAVVDTCAFDGSFAWTDEGWRGVALADAVIYELHVGTFTAPGTLDAAIAELPRLAELGVSLVELMPVGQFPGARNWGYDGVFPYAVESTYGGPQALARFVDAAHGHGIGVLLDVVYNHLGPEGAVQTHFGPYLTAAHRTPWGDAVNLGEAGSDGVRAFFVENACRWVRDFRVDGLRLDAADTIVDLTAYPFLEQLTTAVHDTATSARRRVLVFAEQAANDPRYLHAPDRGGYGMDAVWDDDVHHVLHVLLTGERHGYYVDYDGSPAQLADAIEHRWSFHGRWSTHRGRTHGRPVDDVAPRRFVVFTQNHDQVGNRPHGDRLTADPAARRAATALVLLSPFTPLLFMGEEYGETAPFPFFVDHTDPDVLQATRRGRREEFAGPDWDADVPDPGSEETFALARIAPTVAERDPHRSTLAMHVELLRLRREVGPICADATQRVTRHDSLVVVERRTDDDVAVLLANVGDAAVTAEVAPPEATVVFDSGNSRWGGDGAPVAVHGGSVTVPPWTTALLRASASRSS